MASSTCGIGRFDKLTRSCIFGKVGSMVWVTRNSVTTYIKNKDQLMKINGTFFSLEYLRNQNLSTLCHPGCFQEFGDNWIPRLGSNSCYQVTFMKANFSVSRDHCTRQRSDLTTTLDEDEARFVQGNQRIRTNKIHQPIMNGILLFLVITSK